MSMFSTTLEEVMEIQEEKFPGLDIPWVIIELCEAILRLRGPSTQGIFRQAMHFMESSTSYYEVTLHFNLCFI